eukprot:992720-Amphidinium_carterae.1
MVDASPSGLCVMRRKELAEDNATEGRWQERRRYKRLPAHMWNFRELALADRDVLSDPLTVLPLVRGEVEVPSIPRDGFPEVSNRFLAKNCWHELYACPLKLPEGIHAKEGRAVLCAMRSAARDLDNHGKWVLILDDNLGVVLAMSRGRCANYTLLRIAQRICALSLACHIYPFYRWISSELNLADSGSRRWMVGRAARACK